MGWCGLGRWGGGGSVMWSGVYSVKVFMLSCVQNKCIIYCVDMGIVILLACQNQNCTRTHAHAHRHAHTTQQHNTMQQKLYIERDCVDSESQFQYPSARHQHVSYQVTLPSQSIHRRVSEALQQTSSKTVSAVHDR